MSNIKYTDESGEHRGTLTLVEYYKYAHNYNEHDAALAARLCGRGWDDTDYTPFKRAVSKKYNTEVLEAHLV